MHAGTVYVNGKFLAQATTGVQRVAARLLLGLDAWPVAHEAGTRWVVLCPGGVQPPQYRRLRTRVVGRPGLPLHLWEQLVLPWAARGGRLLNLAGSSPAWGAGQWCCLHDAAVFDHPEAYTPAFVRWYRMLFRLQARRAARLLTVSAYSRGRLALHLGVAPERIRVVPNGGDHLDQVTADDAVLRQHGLHGKAYLLAVGSANPTKNHARLLQAFARLSDLDGLHLVLVGGRHDGVFAAAQDGPSGTRVVRVGPQGDAALKALYTQATGLVFPSLYEGFGLPPLEAMSCGCPAAVARAASMPEVCGEAALYFDPRSVEDMAGAMRRLATDAALRLALAAAGRRHLQGRGWSDAVRSLLAALEQAP